jgi:hypothetical protein
MGDITVTPVDLASRELLTSHPAAGKPGKPARQQLDCH